MGELHLLPKLLDDHRLEDALDLLSPHLPGPTPTSNTRLAHLATLRAFFRWTDHEWRSILHPDPKLAPDYLKHLETTLSPRSVKNHLSRLQGLYRLLHTEGLVPAGTNPFTLIVPPNPHLKDARDAYTIEELQRLLDHSDATWRAMLLLGAHAGLRKEEVLELTWNDLAPIPGGVSVYGRPIPNSKALRDALNAHAKSTGQGSLNRLHDRTSPLFEPIAEYLLRRRLFALCRRASVPPLAWMGLRNHALLRTLHLTGHQALPQVVSHSQRRNTHIVRQLLNQPVLLGPRRTRRRDPH